MNPESIAEPVKVHVNTYAYIMSKTGERYDFEIEDENGKSWTLSSWSIESKKRFTPDDLCGKDVILSKSKDEKKIFLEFCPE